MESDLLRPKILLVDDDLVNLLHISEVLKREYDVVTASEGKRALELAASNGRQPDMILLDVGMPDMDGFEVIRQLKSSQSTSRIPVIFLTAYDTPENESRGLELGAADFIHKPINKNVLLARMRTSLALERKQREYAESESFLRATLESTKDGIVVLDNTGRISMVNRQLIDMWGFPEDVVASHDLEKYIEHASSILVEGDNSIKQFRAAITGDIEDEALIEFKDNRFFTRVIRPLYRAGKIEGHVISYTDITDQKRHEEQLRVLAVTDELTGLYNRRLMLEIMEKEIGRALRYGYDGSLHVVDIDKFKNVNDTYGHQTGDKVLKSLANIMRHVFRGVDYLFRYGGEEFVVMLPNTSFEGSRLAANRLRTAFGQSKTDGVQTTLSVGFAMFKDIVPDNKPERLLTFADNALYEAKRRGRNMVLHISEVEEGKS